MLSLDGCHDNDSLWPIYRSGTVNRKTRSAVRVRVPNVWTRAVPPVAASARLILWLSTSGSLTCYVEPLYKGPMLTFLNLIFYTSALAFHIFSLNLTAQNTSAHALLSQIGVKHFKVDISCITVVYKPDFQHFSSDILSIITWNHFCVWRRDLITRALWVCVSMFGWSALHWQQGELNI